MNILIGDIGNTLTKICLLKTNNYQLKKIVFFNSKDINSRKILSKILRKLIKNKPLQEIALFSSVVPKYKSLIKKYLKTVYKINLREIREKEINKIIKINIKNKKQVGSDRIANAVGAFIKYKTNCIIVDFGTATTFDVVTKFGTYNGGIIAPGIKLSIKSLSSSADQIPNFFLKKQKKIIGKNTIEALRSGFYEGYSGLIDRIIFKIYKHYKKNFKIILTGGYAYLFEKNLNYKVIVDKLLTIKGLVEIYRYNFL